jgi:hypothetical protein
MENVIHLGSISRAIRPDDFDACEVIRRCGLQCETMRGQMFLDSARIHIIDRGNFRIPPWGRSEEIVELNSD